MLINRNYCCRNIYSVVFGTDFMYILMETFTEYFKLVKNIYTFHIYSTFVILDIILYNNV